MELVTTPCCAPCRIAAWLGVSVMLVALAGGCGSAKPSAQCDSAAPLAASTLYLVNAGTTCDGLGSDVKCQAHKRFTDGLGKGTHCLSEKDVTDVTVWASSDTAVAALTTPGFFQVLTSGQFEITASIPDGLSNNQPYVTHQAFLVAPGIPPELMFYRPVIVQELIGTTLTRVEGATVRLEPPRGNTVQCETNGAGFCQGFTVRDAVQLTVSKPGYQAAVQDVAANFFGNTFVTIARQ